MATLHSAPPAENAARKNSFCCPRCGCIRVYRSQRRDFQEKLKCLLQRVLPYRCRDCDLRFFARKPKPE